MKKESPRTKLRIVDQNRTMHMRGYDLACEGARMRVVVAPVNDETGGRWRVEATIRSEDRVEVAVANETGPTRTEALRSVATTMRGLEPQTDIAMFDWEAVEALLVSVQALEPSSNA